MNEEESLWTTIVTDMLIHVVDLNLFGLSLGIIVVYYPLVNLKWVGQDRLFNDF